MQLRNIQTVLNGWQKYVDHFAVIIHQIFTCEYGCTLQMLWQHYVTMNGQSSLYYLTYFTRIMCFRKKYVSLCHLATMCFIHFWTTTLFQIGT